jgi:hypothetical protein
MRFDKCDSAVKDGPLGAALRALALNIAPLPIRTDGSKAPAVKWEAYQDRLPTEAECRRWWGGDNPPGVALICGAVSGCLEVIDFDDEAAALFPAWRDRVEADCPGLADRLSFVRTPGGGYHVRYRCPDVDVPGNTKLAMDAEKGTLIETRGEGGYVLAPGCPPECHPSGGTYELLDGHPDDPPGLSIEEHEAMLRHARSFDRRAARTPDAPPRPVPAAAGPAPWDLTAGGTDNRSERARRWLRKCDPAISRQGGHDQTFKAACALVHGFELTDAEAWPLLEEYNRLCQPPWSDKELRHKLDSARKGGKAWSRLADGAGGSPGPGKSVPRGTMGDEPRAVSRCCADVTSRAIRWLWPGRVAYGKLTVCDGDPDRGKSTLWLDVAARASGGRDMPPGPGTPGAADPVTVGILSAEDDAEDTIVPRLQLAGADLSRVHVLDGVRGADGRTWPATVPENLPDVEDWIKANGIRLLIIDPLMAYLGNVDSGIDQSMRKALFALSEVAKRNDCAVVCLRHFNKGSSTKAIHKGGGSIAIIGHARAGVMVGTDPDDEHKRVLAVTKANRAAPAPSLRFALEPVVVDLGGEKDTLCRVEWLGVSPYTADQLVQPPATDEQKAEKALTQTKHQAALALLREQLADTGTVSRKATLALAEEANISQRTLDAAARELGVQGVWIKTGDGKEYHWRLAKLQNGPKSSGYNG